MKTGTVSQNRKTVALKETLVDRRNNTGQHLENSLRSKDITEYIKEAYFGIGMAHLVACLSVAVATMPQEGQQSRRGNLTEMCYCVPSLRGPRTLHYFS